MADQHYASKVQGGRGFDNFNKHSREGQGYGNRFMQPGGGFGDLGMFHGSDMLFKQIKIEVDERNKKYFEVNDDLNNDW